LKKPPDKDAELLTAVEVRICSLSREAREVETTAERYGAVRTRKECAEESARVRTMYKRKDKKVNPVDAPLPNGVNPGGGAIRRRTKSEEGERDEKHAGKTVQRGSRLTPERLEKMRMGMDFC
jgi:transposase InsO family protein